jgi:fructoselysine and glucoselysine-specific PTS system IIB component
MLQDLIQKNIELEIRQVPTDSKQKVESLLDK